MDNNKQFELHINNKEISQIENSELRTIREKYWSSRHKAFLDEHGIPDWELEKVCDELDRQEQQEIDDFKRRNNILD